MKVTYVVFELKPIAGPARLVFVALAAVWDRIQMVIRKKNCHEITIENVLTTHLLMSMYFVVVVVDQDQMWVK